MVLTKIQEGVEKQIWQKQVPPTEEEGDNWKDL